jgi:PAS domain S-box-containing protein
VAGEIDGYAMDKRYLRKDGITIWIRLNVRLMKDAAGRPLYFLPMMEDISERKQAEEKLWQLSATLEARVQQRTAELEASNLRLMQEMAERQRMEAALRESEAQYRTLFETMAQGVVYHGAKGGIHSANPAAERILGLTQDQFLGRTSLDPRWHAIHEDGSPFPGETHPVMIALSTGQPVWNVIMGVFHPAEEQHRWIIVNATPQFRPGENAPFQVYATFADITERKQAEDQLRRLAQAAAVTEERQRLARDLHDSVTQLLYGLMLNAATAEEELQDDNPTQARACLAEARQTAQQVLKEMRLLLYELRPEALQRHGLVETLRLRLESVERRAGVSPTLTVNGPSRLWESVAQASLWQEELHRIITEALNNALKHAAATTVNVCLQGNPGGLEVEIADNGQGFDHQASAHSGGLGLTTMRERAEQLGGALTIQTASGRGTVIRAQLPWPAELLQGRERHD